MTDAVGPLQEERVEDSIFGIFSHDPGSVLAIIEPFTVVGIELFADLFFSLGLIEKLGFKMIVAPFANRELRQPAFHCPKNPLRHGLQFPTSPEPVAILLPP
jgi:hypothetical protein